MKRIALLLLAAATVAAVAGAVTYVSRATRQAGAVAAVYVTVIPPGYRDWKLISVAHEEGNLNSFAAILGNDLAFKAARDGKLPYPDGSIIAALHYGHVPSDENNKVFGQKQSYVPGSPTNVQFMIKDAKKYAATGGWSYGHFGTDGKPAGESVLKSCAPCHAMATRDAVFTRYAP